MSRCYSLIFVFLLISIPLITAQRSGGSSSSHTTYHSSSSSSSGGSCSSSCGIILGVVLTVAVIIAIIICCCKHGACQNQMQEQINREYLESRPTSVSQRVSFHPCSGTWRGSYRGTSWRNAGSHIMSVELSFYGNQFQGYHGSDEVGTFTVEGDVNHNKIAFIKRYGYERPVRYQGVLTSNNSMKGTWHLQNGDHGTWELTCVQPTVVVAQVAPVYQATVAQPQSHVIELSHLAATTAPAYSNPSPQHTPRSITPVSVTAHPPTPRLSASPHPVTPRLSATPQLGTPRHTAPLNPQAEGLPPSYDLSVPVQTYVPTYGVPQATSS